MKTRTTKFLLALGLFVVRGLVRAEDGQDGVVATAAVTAWRTLDYSGIPQSAVLSSKTRWSNGLLVLYDTSASTPTLYGFDRDGKMELQSLIELPGVRMTKLIDFAAATDGSVWACGFSTSTSGQLSSFLAHVSRQGSELRIIRTEPYEPQRIAVAPDGSVWTVGIEVPGNGTRKIDRSRDILRRFDPAGRFVGSAIPLTTVGDMAVTRNGRLAAANDRVAWYAGGYTHEGEGGHYFEFFPDTRTLKSYDPVPGNNLRTVVFELALTPSDIVYAFADEAVRKGENKTSIFRLERTSGRWQTIGVPTEAGQIPDMKGNDGEKLVFAAPPEKARLSVMEVR